MSKTIKFKNNMYLDTRGAVHNGTILKTYLDNEKTRVDGKQNKLYDSGWKYLTLQNGATIFNENNKPRYRKIGNIVYLDGLFSSPATSVTSPLTIATLPSGYRPSSWWKSFIIRNGTNSCICGVNKGGVTGEIWIQYASAEETSLNGIVFVADA